MRLAAILLTLSSVASLAESAPYLPKDGKLQRHRRRGVDYPFEPYGVPEAPQSLQLRKRTVPYSVVPVDGGTAAAGQTVTTTIIDAVPTTVKKPPHTKTVVVTKKPKTKTLVQTEVVTTTDVSPAPTMTVDLPPQVVTETEAPVYETVAPVSKSKSTKKTPSTSETPSSTKKSLPSSTQTSSSSKQTPSSSTQTFSSSKEIPSSSEEASSSSTQTSSSSKEISSSSKETPSTLQKPSSKQTPSTSQKPSSKKTPSTSQKPTSKQTPSSSQTPSTTQTSSLVQTPVTTPSPTLSSTTTYNDGMWNPLSTSGFDNGMWNPPYPTDSVPALPSAPAPTGAHGYTYDHKPSYGYGAKGKRALSSEERDETAPAAMSLAARYADAFIHAFKTPAKNEQTRTKRSPGEQVPGTKLSRSQLRRLRRSMR